MKSASFNHLAERELDEAVEYYELQKRGLGEELLVEVEKALVFLGRYSEAAPKVSEALRRFVLPGSRSR